MALDIQPKASHTQTHTRTDLSAAGYTLGSDTQDMTSLCRSCGSGPAG